MGNRSGRPVLVSHSSFSIRGSAGKSRDGCIRRPDRVVEPMWRADAIKEGAAIETGPEPDVAGGLRVQAAGRFDIDATGGEALCI